MATVNDIYEFIDKVAPFKSQVEWDNSGLLVGDKNNEVTKVCVCLDVTERNLQKAIDMGANLIVSHHPIIWDPMKFVPSDTVVSMAIRNRINVISAHTNWDCAEGGVSNVLATILGMPDAEPLEAEGELSMVYVGKLKTAVPARDFAELVAEALDTVVSLSCPDKMIETIAVCGGAGASFWADVMGKADALVTGEVHHHDYIDAEKNGLCLMAAGHYETETISMPVLLALLKQEFADVEFTYLEDAPVIYIG